MIGRMRALLLSSALLAASPMAHASSGDASLIFVGDIMVAETPGELGDLGGRTGVQTELVDDDSFEASHGSKRAGAGRRAAGQERESAGGATAADASGGTACTADDASGATSP